MIAAVPAPYAQMRICYAVLPARYLAHTSLLCLMHIERQADSNTADSFLPASQASPSAPATRNTHVIVPVDVLVATDEGLYALTADSVVSQLRWRDLKLLDVNGIALEKIAAHPAASARPNGPPSSGPALVLSTTTQSLQALSPFVPTNYVTLHSFRVLARDSQQVLSFCRDEQRHSRQLADWHTTSTSSEPIAELSWQLRAHHHFASCVFGFVLQQ